MLPELDDGREQTSSPRPLSVSTDWETVESRMNVQKEVEEQLFHMFLLFCSLGAIVGITAKLEEPGVSPEAQFVWLILIGLNVSFVAPTLIKKVLRGANNSNSSKKEKK